MRRTGSDNDPTALTGDFDIHNRLETKLADEKPPASFLIANPQGREIEPQEWAQGLSRARAARTNRLIGLSLAFHLPEDYRLRILWAPTATGDLDISFVDPTWGTMPLTLFSVEMCEESEVSELSLGVRWGVSRKGRNGWVSFLKRCGD